MTNNQLIDERVTSVIERLEHYACNLKWTNVRGSQDLLTAADGLRELQERRKADSEPLVPVVDVDDNFYSWFGREWHENYQHNQYTTAAKQMLGVMAESAWKAGRCSAMLQAGDTVRDLSTPVDPQVAEYEQNVMQAGNSPVIPDAWIPVSERMPEDEQEVLTINRMGHRFVSFFDKHSGLFFDRLDAPSACCIEHVLVTHWMELPAAPQEARKSNVIDTYQGADGKDHPIINLSGPLQEVK
ncbi:TPA: DUF551 domain-containing protein [Klebsiella aerogenes]|nr:DUF551 domain-containing protein [Klebsiella aerogenes]